MWNTIKEKMKSWAMWLAIAGLVVWIVKTFVKIDIADELNQFLNILLPILVGFGIVNNPNERNGI